MADLTAKLPAGIDPVAFGDVTLSEVPMGAIWAVMPYRGQTEALSAAMETAHGLAYPAPNRMTEAGAVRAAFSGLDQAFLIGAVPEAGLSAHAALTDQSDAWTHLALEGAGARDVLARLVPLDMSEAVFPVGSAKRSSLGHMAAVFLRPSATRVEILVFRSMAKTAVHELDRAMKAVAARAAL